MSEPRPDRRALRRGADPKRAPALGVDLLREALGEPAVEGEGRAFAGVAIDSRTLGPGSLFVGLRGERHDGSAFAGAAVTAGAAGVVAEAPPPAELPPSVTWWQVKDGLAALRRLAFAHRRRMPARVVCVTGSNGKTGTKELVADVLAMRDRVCRTRGNLNSQVGLPLSLLELEPGHAWGVFEIGASRPGEIARLAALAQPDIGVITNVAVSHLAGLATLEGVIREKTDLAAALGREGTLVYGGDGEALRAAVAAFRCPRLSFGTGPVNDVRPEAWELDADGRPVFSMPDLGRVRLRLAGSPALLNALAAIAVGRVAGVPPHDVRRALEAAEPLPLRMEVVSAGGVTVIQDCYNANPDSVRRSVETLRSLAGRRARVAVLGAMRELGAEAESLHYELGRELGRTPLDLMVAFGEEALPLARGYQATTRAPVHYVRDGEALVRFLSRRVPAPAAVLFKASRGVALEEAAGEYLATLRSSGSSAARAESGGNGHAVTAERPS